MKLTNLSIENFRGVHSLNVDVGGHSLLFLGANGAGKSALLAAMAKALGADRGVKIDEFVDPSRPVEITATLSDLGSDLAGKFNRHATFAAGGPFLTVGVHASIDGPEVETTHGFPNSGWTSATRAQLRALPVLWLSADRQHRQLLSLVGARSLLAGLVGDLDLDADLVTAGVAVADAAAALARAKPLQRLLKDTSQQLEGILSDAQPDAFGLRAGAPIDLLRQLELLITYAERSSGLSEQPSGLGQLSILSFALVAIARRPGTVALIDEPELSLHPHAERAAVTRLREGPAQVLLATHSANSLSRWDLRRAIRLESGTQGTHAHLAGHVSDKEERRLSRYASPSLVEAFFARSVYLVEGAGDRLAVRAAAERYGADLDASGVSVVELDGADLFASMRSLLGPQGLGVRVFGLCDADRERSWANVVLGKGTYTGDRSLLAQHGVYVLDPDLETVLVEALGEERAEEVIAADGAADELALFRKQPTQREHDSREQLIRFIKKGKARWPPLLVLELSSDELPQAITGLLANG